MNTQHHQCTTPTPEVKPPRTFFGYLYANRHNPANSVLGCADIIAAKLLLVITMWLVCASTISTIPILMFFAINATLVIFTPEVKSLFFPQPEPVIHVAGDDIITNTTTRTHDQPPYGDDGDHPPEDGLVPVR